MDYHSRTVSELRQIAKARGLIGYSRLRKADLVSLLCSYDIKGKGSNIIDTPIPDINIPTLIPSNHVTTSQRTIFNNVLSELKNKIRSNINLFSDWLINYIPPKITKTVNDKLESLKLTVSNLFKQMNDQKFEIQESESAMNGFTKKHCINVRSKMDAVTFLNKVRPQIISFLGSNRDKKKLILSLHVLWSVLI